MNIIKIFLALILFASSLYGQTPGGRADSLLQNAIPENEHAIAVLVASEGQVLYHKVVGYAHRADQIPADEHTIFRIGSVTKQFTAAAILKLVEEGKMSLQDALSQYIIDFPKGDSVTIHHLLNHTSGIKSYTDQAGFMERVEEPVDQQKLIEEIKSLGYDFSPGEKWKYNNSGYFILGYLVEKVSGMPYEKYLKKNFFKPAGMRRSGVYFNEDGYKNEAIGYMALTNGIEKAINWDMSWAGGAGNLYSTVADLNQWNNKLFAGELLDKSSLEKAFTAVKLNDGSEYPYGYGWGIGEFKGLKRIGHSGGLHGFLSYLVHYPDIKTTVAVLSNCSQSKNVVPAELAESLTKLFFDEHLEADEEVAVDYAFYDKYVGRYEYPGGAVMNITREGDHLYGQLSGQPKYEIFPKGDHRFFWKVVDAEITFHFNENGEVDYAIHKQNGFESKAPRMADQQEMALGEGVFERYAGDYNLPGGIIKIWEEDNKYFAQVTGQAQFRMYPKSVDRFFMKDLAVEIEFEDEGEKSASLTLYQAGQEIKAERKE